jgi:hypothetical protein
VDAYGIHVFGDGHDAGAVAGIAQQFHLHFPVSGQGGFDAKASGGIGGQPANMVDGVAIEGREGDYYSDHFNHGLISTEDMVAMFPNVDVQDGYRWIDQGNVITSAGISAGIDMSLFLVAQMASHELAEKTARQMEYSWAKNG